MKNTIYALSARDIQECLVKGFTKSDFCEKFFCEEAAFLNQLSLVYGKNDKEYRRIIRKLGSNEKQKGRKKKSVVPEPVDELAELKSKESAQSDVVIAIETEHKDLCSKHRVCIDTLRRIDKDIDEIKQLLDKACVEYTETITTARQLEGEMTQISHKYRQEKAALDEIRSKIESLTHAVVFVSQSGSIELAEGEIELNDDGFEELYKELRDIEFYEDLKVKEIKQLARVICIARNSSIDIEFMFDSQILEDFFKKAQK